MTINRREFMMMAAASAVPFKAFAVAAPSIVVVGAGFGGATFARYASEWMPNAKITVIDPSSSIISCPLSNFVVAGRAKIEGSTYPLNKIAGKNVKLMLDSVTAIDHAGKTVTLASGTKMKYDRLVLSPGVDFMFDKIPGLSGTGKALHAYKAGPQTTELSRQISALRDDETMVMTIPTVPYRCPPAPYERACLVADALIRRKSKAKLIVVDGNPDFVIEKELFSAMFKEYSGTITHLQGAKIESISESDGIIKTDFDTLKAQVMNIIPPMSAGKIAVSSGLANEGGGRWCGVDWKTMESVVAPGVHILGDSTFSNTGVPKSGHLANNEAKIAAMAIAMLEAGKEAPATPIASHTCYSFVRGKEAGHVSALFRYDATKKMLVRAEGTGGSAKLPTPDFYGYGIDWWRSIMFDSFGVIVPDVAP